MAFPGAIWSKIRADAAAAKSCYTSKMAVWKLTKQRKADGQALIVAYRDIGRGATGTKAAEERKSYGTVKSTEQLLAEAEAALAERQAEAGASKARMDQRTQVRNGEISALDAEHKLAAESHAQAAAYCESLRRDIRDGEARLALPPEKEAGQPPREEAQKKIADAQVNLPAAENAEAGWKAHAEAKLKVLDTEKQAWAAEYAKLYEEYKAREDAAATAQKHADQCRTELESAFENLGQSMMVAGAGVDIETLVEPVKRASDLKARIQDAEQKILHHKDVVAATKKGFLRFLGYTGGAFLGLVVLGIVLAAVL
ncbi:MAG: hypothetical protein MUE73_02870 [Planctomycetes bacterium]|jgi:chromosome segregation ATPase|nr:hypothetical protein [Planctomycetota bacterium]